MVRAKARPWKSIIALVLAICAAGASSWARGYFRHFFGGDDWVGQVIAASAAVAFCVFASAATIGLSGKARDVLQPVAGASHASAVRYALVLVGMVTTLVVTLVLFGVPVGQLLLAGGLSSVFVGIAAQQALSNVFAGLVLLLAHPFKVGDSVRLRAGAMSGELGGTVNEIGITYLRLGTPDGVLSIPNSLVLSAVVGPLPPGSRLPAPAQPAPATTAVSGLFKATLPGTASPPGTVSPPVPVNPPTPADQPAVHTPAADAPLADGSPTGPGGTADGAGGAHRPGSSGEQ